MPDIAFARIPTPTPTLEAVRGRYEELRAAYDGADDAGARLEALRSWDALRR